MAKRKKNIYISNSGICRVGFKPIIIFTYSENDTKMKHQNPRECKPESPYVRTRRSNDLILVWTHKRKTYGSHIYVQYIQRIYETLFQESWRSGVILIKTLRKVLPTLVQTVHADRGEAVTQKPREIGSRDDCMNDRRSMRLDNVM